MFVYSAQAISREDSAAVVARIGRYVKRHGGAYCEYPLTPEGMDEAISQIVFDWQSADWIEMEWKYLVRTGRLLFDPDAEPIANHLRAALYCAGRCRKRGWRDASPEARRVARGERRRDREDFTGAGMASRSPSPDRIAMAIETAGMEGLRSVPRREAAKRLRWAKTRNSGHYPRPVACFDDCTYIEWLPRQRNFQRIGSVRNRATAKTLRRVKGWSATQLREALTGN